MKALTAFASTIAAVILAGCGSAPVLRAGPGPVPTTSVEQADQRLAAVARERAAIEARFADRERVCYEKFLVNYCLDEAKERRRVALQAQREIEMEAERFKRRAKVEERDRAMAEAEAQYKAEEARMAAEPPPPPREVTEAPPPRPAPVADRVAQHQQKLKEAAAREQAQAGKRAENVRRYEQRKRESEERQRRVAERRAEKAAKEAKQQGKDAPAQAPKQQ